MVAVLSTSLAPEILFGVEIENFSHKPIIVYDDVFHLPWVATHLHINYKIRQLLLLLKWGVEGRRKMKRRGRGGGRRKGGREGGREEEVCTYQISSLIVLLLLEFCCLKKIAFLTTSRHGCHSPLLWCSCIYHLTTMIQLSFVGGSTDLFLIRTICRTASVL